MKLKNLLLAAGFMCIAMFPSCNNASPEADVKKLAGFMCESAELSKKLLSEKDEAKQKEIQAQMEEVQKEAEEFSKSMEEKYKDIEEDKEMQEKIQSIMKEEMKKCDALKDMVDSMPE
ncbi:MAG: hypothetical protein AAF734_01775 [Bacteroidota bacterium]